jgi:peptidoglycan/LPS O-acetylase OafA/YrhL
MSTVRDGRTPGVHGGSKVSDLQVLRGISILLVLLCHFGLPKTLLGRFPIRIHDPFFLGVEIFFILSGYVVCKSLMRDGFHAGRFFVRRVFRLYPAIIAFLVFSWAVDSLLRYSSIPPGGTREILLFGEGELLRQSRDILSGAFIPRSGPTAYSNGAMWSLSVEFQFYAVVGALCAAAIHLCRMPPRWASQCLLGVCASVFAFSLLLRFGVLCGYSVESWSPRWLFYAMHWRFDFMALGVLVAGIETHLGDRLEARWKSMATHWSPWLLLTPLMAMSLCETPFHAVEKKPFLIGFGHPIAAACFAVLVMIASRNLAFPESRGRLYRTMEWLGDRSFTIYLMHFPIFILAWMIVYFARPTLFSSPVGFGIAQMLLTAAIGLPLCDLVYRGLELPCIEVGKRACKALFAPRSVAVTPLVIADGLRIDAGTSGVARPHLGQSAAITTIEMTQRSRTTEQ